MYMYAHTHTHIHTHTHTQVASDSPSLRSKSQRSLQNERGQKAEGLESRDRPKHRVSSGSTLLRAFERDYVL